MVKASISGSSLILKLEGVKKFLALKGTLKIPLRSIQQVSTDRVKWRYLPVARIGTHLPRVMMAGTFWTGEGKIFYYMRDPKRCVTLTLKNHEYSEIIFQVADKHKVAMNIRSHLRID